MYRYKPKPLPPPARQPKPTKQLWEVRKGFDTYTCELIFHDGGGTEARISKNGEWFVASRFEEGWQALAWAEEVRLYRERGGGDE
jgi:hypothetical protein